jgi:hypothetical protein
MSMIMFCAHLIYALRYLLWQTTVRYMRHHWEGYKQMRIRKKNAQRIQRWFRTGRKQTFRRWLHSRVFNEWFYAPNGVGGKQHKRRMMHYLSHFKREPKQEWIQTQSKKN